MHFEMRIGGICGVILINGEIRMVGVCFAVMARLRLRVRILHV